MRGCWPTCSFRVRADRRATSSRTFATRISLTRVTAYTSEPTFELPFGSGLAKVRTMRSSLGVRRQPRKVAQEDDEDVDDARPGQEQGKKSTLSLSKQLSNVCVCEPTG